MNRPSTLKLIGRSLFMIIAILAVSACGAFASELQEGCTNPFACNYNPESIEDDGSCEYLSCIGCMNEFACNFDPLAIYPDLSCEYFTCAGCTSPLACNYDDSATVPDDTSCDFESCAGCTDFTACNFDSEATLSTPITCEYPEPDYDCEGNSIGCINCAPVFLSSFTPDTVACASELPTGPDDEIIAIVPATGDTLEVQSFLASITGDYTLNLGTTALGAGPDGAIRLFGLSQQLGLANSDYFIESFPLMVSRYANGIAVVTGQVADAANASLKWNVHLVLEDVASGTDWIEANENHDFVTAYECEADTANWTTYRMNNEQSYLLGAGGYEGSYLQLSHMPFSESKRFQCGVGGNGVNCEYGLGGWFSWEGAILGQTVMGMSGDLVIDMGEDVTLNVPCGSEYVMQFYNALNADSGDFTEEIQYTYAVDTTAPVMEASCENLVSLCFDSAAGIALPEVCSFNADNCGGELTTNLNEIILSGDPSTNAPFEIERTYTASDCSGNVATFVQNLVFDGTECEEPEGLITTAFDSASSDAGQTTPNGQTNQANDTFSGWTRSSTIAPNPTESSSVLTVRDAKEAMTIRVFNLAGRQSLPTIALQETESRQLISLQLDGQSLPSGCYLVRLESSSRIETIRWIVSK